MRILRCRYKGWNIFFADDEMTAPNPHWEIANDYGNTMQLCGLDSIEDVKRFIDNDLGGRFID